MRRGTVLFLTFLSALFLTSSFNVFAQTDDDEAFEGLLEEVVVTAQRREQSLMDVPISVMVFNAETIEQNNMKGAADYLLMTPNVNFREDGRGGQGSINIAIRGISDLSGGERVQATQAMGFYWDEFSVATIASGTANPPIYDVQAVEVLRGPQGTYFGRNAEGGAINIQTNKPTQEFYGQVDLSYGNFDTYEISGVLNLPITDTLALRTVLNNEKSDGFVKNTHPTGGSSDYTLNSARTKLRWTPNDRAIVDLGIAYSENEQGYAPMVATCINPTFGFDPSDPAVLGGIKCSNGGGKKTYQNTIRNSTVKNTLLTANISYDWDNIRLTSITGEIKSEFDQVLDLDHSGIDSVDRFNNYETKSFSSELRFSSIGEHTIDWTVGGLVYDDSLTANNIIDIRDFLGPWLRDDYANENQINIDRDGWALFADLTWHINDRTNLTFGGRYSSDNDKQYWRNVYAACPRRSPGDPLSGPCQLRPDQSLPLPIYTDGGGNQAITGGRAPQTEGTDVKNDGTDFSPRIAINWDMTDSSMLYGIWSQGYKSAGARANPDSGGENNSIFDKEKLNNYEIGLKGRTSDGRLRYELAAFYMVWEDFQATIRESLCRLPDGSLVPNDGTVPPEDCTITPIDRIENAPKAKSKGVEATLSWLPVDNWLFGVTAGYLDAEFTDFDNVPIGGSIVDLSGETMPNAPKWTSTVTGQYNFEVGAAQSYARLEWSYRESYKIGLSDPDDLARQVWPYVTRDYNVLNFRAGMDWGRHRLALTIDNILGEDYTTGVDTFSYAGVMVDTHPTTWALRYTVRTD